MLRGAGGLEDDLGSELHLASRVGSVEAAEGTVGDVSVECAVVGVVEDVEGVGLKLELDALAEVKELGEGQVGLLEARHDDTGDSGRTEGSGRS